MLKRLKNCKKCYLFLIVLGFVMLVTAISDKSLEITATRLPWQIDVSTDGLSNVFGISLSKTSMREAIDLLGSFPDTALFEHKNGRRNVEAYFGSVNIEGITAKLVLEYELDENTLDRLISNSIKREGTPSGAFKYELDERDRIALLSSPITSITYVPFVEFDEDIILQRFGLATETVQINEHASFWLYPELGLSILYDTENKEVLQYVAPRDFYRIYDMVSEATAKTQD